MEAEPLAETPFGVFGLTRREISIASMIAVGASNRRIAEDLWISPHTVAAHLCSMLRRMGASNRTELIARLYAEGVLAQGAWPPLPAEHVRAARPHEGNGGPVTMTFDALHALREAGHPVDLLSQDQRSVLAGLSEHEVRVLNTVKDRLEAASGEVEGQDLKLL
ncbi:DNA-binding CsgD family transcriptional regulator [Streptacidiphilus sp. MAP12-33]|uniref:helix-turn-helix domain-containing protein n=1 Tax=Streptacidiphilus sp. MAP12-33 TaxID=3156266 RepID=UPI0035167298